MKFFKPALIILFALIVFACAVLPTFAVEYVYSMTYNITYDGGVDQGVNTLQDYYDHYRAALDAYSTSIYYFELMYTEMGISRPANPYYYVTNTNGSLSWDLPYSAYNSATNELTNPIVRFYVPDPTWEFEIRLSDGTQTLFRSSDQTATLTDNNVYYYQFTVSLNQITSSTNGWYIYSQDLIYHYSPNPIEPSDQYTVTFNYLNSSNQIVSTQTVAVNSSTNIVDVTIPTLNGYDIISASGSGIFMSPNIFRFTSLTSDQTVTVNVLTNQESIDQAFDRGYNSGYIQGQNDYKNSSEFRALIDAAFDEGRQEGYQSGYQSGYQEGFDVGSAESGTVVQNIDNPLLWVTEPVSSFLGMNLGPNINLGVLFLACIAVSLVVIFLKIFAGG